MLNYLLNKNNARKSVVCEKVYSETKFDVINFDIGLSLAILRNLRSYYFQKDTHKKLLPITIIQLQQISYYYLCLNSFLQTKSLFVKQNPIKWPTTLEQFASCWRRIVRVCSTIFRGWHLDS